MKYLPLLTLTLAAGCTSPQFPPSSARQLAKPLEIEAHEYCIAANQNPDIYFNSRTVAWTVARRKALFQLVGYEPDCVTWKCLPDEDVSLEVQDNPQQSLLCKSPRDLESQARASPIVRKQVDDIIDGTGRWDYESWLASQPRRTRQ